jgi:methyltransferase family protein
MQPLVALARRLPPGLQKLLISLYWSRFNYKVKVATLLRYRAGVRDHPLLAAKYLAFDPEIDNFTYDLANEDELVAFLAASLDRDPREIERYLAEVADDVEFDRLLHERLRKKRWTRKQRPHFGRRLGWYVIARAVKPSLVVETGIHDGLGSVLLLRALHHNAIEGHDGRLISFDTNPHTGWLVSEPLGTRWRPVYAATSAALEHELEGQQVGMIVHDSEHTYECEHFELTTAVAHAAPTIALVSDNAHGSTALDDVATSLGIDYHFFRERPRDHFYPGAGIGFALLSRPTGAG